MASKRSLTLEEVLTQVLASDDEDSDIEIESEDSYSEEEDSQGDISEEEVDVVDVDDGLHPDPLSDDALPVDSQEEPLALDVASITTSNTSNVSIFLSSFLFDLSYP